MTNQVQTMQNNERLNRFFARLEKITHSMEVLFTSRKPTIGGECFYTDRDLSEKLKISRRSLQDYRNEGRIPYIRLGGKILYRASDIDKLLEECYREKFRYPQRIKRTVS